MLQVVDHSPDTLPFNGHGRAARRSDDDGPGRILTTHTGSLPRPDDLIRMMWAKADGVPVDAAALDERIALAVHEVVERQSGLRHRHRQRRRDVQAELRHLRAGPPRRLRWRVDPGLLLRRPRRLPAQRRSRRRQPRAAQAQRSGLHRGHHGAARRRVRGRRSSQPDRRARRRGRWRGSRRQLLERSVARCRLALLRQPALPDRRGVPLRHRRGDAGRVRGDRRRRRDRAGRLPGPGHGAALRVRRRWTSQLSAAASP